MTAETTPEADTARVMVTDVCKAFPTRGEPLSVLAGVSFTLAAGEALVIMGPSGSGKSTLLNILGTLDEPIARGETLLATRRVLSQGAAGVGTKGAEGLAAENGGEPRPPRAGGPRRGFQRREVGLLDQIVSPVRITEQSPCETADPFPLGQQPF